MLLGRAGLSPLASSWPIHLSAWKRNSAKFAQPRSYAERCSYVQSRGFLAVHKKHNTPRNTTTPPAILCPLGGAYAELRRYRVLRSSRVLVSHELYSSNGKDTVFG